MAYQLLFDEARRLLLVRFTGPLGRADLEALNADTSAFVVQHGGCDGIIDFSAVTNVDLSVDYLRALGQRSRVMAGFRRVVVAPQPEMFGLARLYGLHQDNRGADQPLVFRTLAEAYASLEVDSPSFEPVSLLPASPDRTG
jgi:hypothetical protein